MNEAPPPRLTTQEIPKVSSETGEHQRAHLGARLVELVGARTGRVHRLSAAEAIIGRDEEVGIRIDAHDVSRRHASIRQDDAGEWILEDLGSRNGTLVNGRPIASASLAFGDHVQLGCSVLFVFTYYDQLEEQILQVQRMESMGSLAGGVAHDFNNLLSVLIGNIDFLEQRRRLGDIDDTLLRECLSEMRDAAGRSEQLIRQLLRFARPSTGAVTNVDCSRLLADVAGLCRRTFGPAIELEVAAAPHLLVYGDAAQLHQVFMNLFINARDAMPTGGRLEVNVSLRALDGEALGGVPFLAPGPFLRVEVRDSGHGMDEETQARVFEPFFTTKQADKGTGIGLSTVYALVRKHGGHIQVRSLAGQGTTFIVYLPAVQPGVQRQSTKPADHLADQAEAFLLGGSTVLLVDDDPAVLRTTGRLLGQIGFDVLEATSGEEAIGLFNKRRREIELVILDILMPGMGGEETLQRLRAIDATVRVLLISGRVDSDAVAPLLAAGAHGFLPKPCGATALRHAIDRVLH